MILKAGQNGVVLKAVNDEHLQVLEGFAEFWKIPYSLQSFPESQQAIMCSGQIPESEPKGRGPVVLTPASREDAKEISEKLSLELNIWSSLIRLPYSPSAETSIETMLYDFKGTRLETIIASKEIPVLSRVKDTNLHLLSIDLVSEFMLQMDRGLEDSPSIKFRLATKLPLSYRSIPSFIRERAFRSHDHGEPSVQKLGPIECLRTAFLASLVAVSETPLPRIGFWRRGKKFALAATHDVETHRGLLKGSPQLLTAEDSLGIRSTWNIVTNRYPIAEDSLHDLAKSGEIGGHDTDHDGRLIFLPIEARIERLRSCRETLERLTGKRVRGFRAPLLQHDKELLLAVGDAGFVFDSSVPSWELRSPTSLKPHGVGTVFPFKVDGVLEMPVSLPQDHQLLRVRQLTVSEAAAELVRVSRWVSEIGGLCTLLVHPDYEFAIEDQGTEYSKLLQKFREDVRCEIMTIGEAADWWSLRNKAYLDDSGGELKVFSPESKQELRDFEILNVTSYGPRGFTVEQLN